MLTESEQRDVPSYWWRKHFIAGCDADAHCGWRLPGHTLWLMYTWKDNRKKHTKESPDPRCASKAEAVPTFWGHWWMLYHPVSVTQALSPRLWHASGCNTCPSANMETMKNCPAFCFLPLLGLCSCYDMAFVVLCQSSGCLYPQIRGKKLSLQCMKQLLRLSGDSWKQRTHLHLQTCTKAGLQSVMCLCLYLIRQTNQTEAAYRHTELLM